MRAPSSGPSHAADRRFRTTVLAAASIEIEGFNAEVPPNASNLIALLSHWPVGYTFDETSNILDFLAEDEQHELSAALDSARLVELEDFRSCRGKSDADWMHSVNLKVLGALVAARRSKQLSAARGCAWRQDPNPQDLHNPKPDYSFGLGLEGTPSLTLRDVTQIHTSPRTRVDYSTVDSRLIFPCLVYESQSDLHPITWAEHRAAAGAARALALLADLSEQSELAYQHCVVAVVSTGSCWRVFVAYQDLHGEKEVHLVPVFEESLQIKLFADRVRLAYILNRILRWIQCQYRTKVVEQVRSLLRYQQQPREDPFQQFSHINHQVYARPSHPGLKRSQSPNTSSAESRSRPKGSHESPVELEQEPVQQPEMSLM